MSQGRRVPKKAPKSNSQEKNLQPQKKRRISRKNTDDYDEDTPPTQHQSQVQITPEEREKLVIDMTRYMLFCDSKKVPITRQHINAQVMKEYNRKLTSTIIEKAKQNLSTIFGYDVVELYKMKNGRPTNKTSGYILLNKMPASIREKYLQFDDQFAKDMAFLMVIIGLIYLNNKIVPQEMLFDLLKRLGFHEGAQNQYYENWEKFLEKFCDQQYLVRTKCVQQASQQNGKAGYEFSIGPRAIEEIGSKNIVEYIGEVLGEPLDPVTVKALEANDAESSDSSSGNSDDSD